MKILAASLILMTSLFSISYAQNQSEYEIKAVKGPYLIIGEKPYKMVGECEGFDVAETVSFSESPITCETATIINLLTLSKCEVQCLANEDLPPEYQ